MAVVYLVSGEPVLVDDEDLELVKQFKWYPAVRRGSTYAATSRGVLMHRLVMKAVKGQLVDHVKHNTLDNRKAELRFCSASQSGANTRSFRGSSSYKGVYWHKRAAKWMAYITVNRKRIHLGLHTSEEEAAAAYDQAAEQHFGAFAFFNLRKN